VIPSRLQVDLDLLELILQFHINFKPLYG